MDQIMDEEGEYNGTRHTQRERNCYLPTEIIPSDNVLWYILHCISEEEIVFMTKYRLFYTIVKLNGVNVVAER